MDEIIAHMRERVVVPDKASIVLWRSLEAPAM